MTINILFSSKLKPVSLTWDIKFVKGINLFIFQTRGLLAHLAVLLRNPKRDPLKAA
jgi:hypothetical protein